jgi:cellulose biosynthesis protein BcsQ
MGVIISIVNNKGGCGKSTVTCNLADALGRAGKNVLVIDMDPQCNTTSILLSDGLTVQKSLFNILDPSASLSDINDLVYPTGCKNVSLIPNIPETAGLESTIASNSPKSLFKLREDYRHLIVRDFDITIMDNPPNIGVFVKSSLNSADFVIVPIRAGSTFSIEGIIKATKLIKEIRAKGNPELRFLRLLINGLDKRTGICRAVKEHISLAFDKEQVFETEIPINTGFEMAESRRETIFQFNSSAKGANAFRLLAIELIQILKGQNGREEGQRAY